MRFAYIGVNAKRIGAPCKMHGMDIVQDAASRLRRARAAAGFPSARQAAIRLGVSEPTYYQYESGERGYSRHAERFAKAFRVSLEWLITGRGDMKGSEKHIRLVGYVGAGAEIFPFDDHAQGAGFEDDLPAPPGLEDAIAVEVRGDSLYPAYWPGDRVYYKRDRDGVPTMALNQECVVQVHNGPMLIKTVKRGSAKGLFDLESYNAAPRPDQRLDWAAPVLWADKRGRFGGRA